MMIVCSPSPPAPGAHFEPCTARKPASSCHDLPPSVVRNIAASSTPAYTVSGSFSDGSRCQTRLNSHGCCVPSYHWCVVRGLPVSWDVSYTNLLLVPPPGGSDGEGIFSPPGMSHVLPPSRDRWMI